MKDNPPPFTSWANFFTEYVIQNFGFDEFEINNYAMSGRALMHNFLAPIWTGEKFNDFMNSNADVFLIMIGTNDKFIDFENG